MLLMQHRDARSINRMRTTVTVDDELLELAKERAHALHLSLGDYLGRAIQVEGAWRAELSAEVPPLPVLGDGSGMHPGVDWRSNAALLEDEVDGRGLTH